VIYVTLDSSDALTYRGGFLLAALASAAVLLSVSCVPTSVAARVLSWRPLTYVGRISYGLYLWHLPLFFFIDNARTGLTGWPLFVVRVAATMVAATLSFYLVERPVRRGTFFSSLKGLVAAGPALGAVVLAVILATLPASVSVAQGVVAHGTVPAMPVADTVPVAYRADPVRVLLVGDSQALTLGLGLQAVLKEDPAAYDNMDVLDEGTLGCGVADGTTGIARGSLFAVGWPCTPYPQRGNCSPGGIFGAQKFVPCQAWTAAWTDWVQEMKPNVVVLLAGGGEVLDRIYDGHLTDILDPTFAAYVKSQLEQAVAIATADGARMILETKPCQSTGEQPDGDPWPEDSAARQAAYNSLLRQVAAARPGQVYVQNLDSYVCPGGHYTEDIDGVPVRQPDGVHFAYGQAGEGGAYLAPAILPYWETIGHLQEASTEGASVNVGPLPVYYAPA
ncbi:MAG: hypothetical protein ACRDY1_16190, partial [Acidimicrobiales bacterium]